MRQFNYRLRVLITGLVCSILAACGGSAGGVTSSKLTSLNDLPDADRILALELSSSSPSDGTSGIFWYDVARKKRYLAAQPEASFRDNPYNWLPEMSIWTGESLVYGHRLHGFFALNADGSTRHLTDFGLVGELSQDGQKILRFTKCDEENPMSGYMITPLNSVGPPLICVEKYVGSDTPWYAITPIWNPYQAQADFIIKTQYGRGSNVRTEAANVVRVDSNGQLQEIISLNTDFPIHSSFAFSARPDGGAVALRTQAQLIELFDWDGNKLGDIDLSFYQQIAVEAGLSAERTRYKRMAWSPDSQAIAIAVDNCETVHSDKRCGTTLLVADGTFGNLKAVATIPGTGFIRDMFLSPDGAYVALLGEGYIKNKLEQDVIYTIEIATGAVEDHDFPNNFFIKRAHWIR